MEHKIEIKLVDKVVWVNSSGTVEFDRNTEAITNAAALAHENNSNLILFDIREATYPEYHVTTIKHAEMASDLGIKPGFRIAVLGTDNQIEMMQYFETVAANRSIVVKVFTNEHDAIEWLMD